MIFISVRLARAVLAEHRVNFTRLDDERHVVVGLDGGILLADAVQREARWARTARLNG